MRLLAILRRLTRVHALGAATICVLVLPIGLLHARALAEILIGVVDALFLAQAWAARDWRWLRSGFARCAAGWWLWLILCSAVGTGGLVLALVAFRLPLFAIALGEFVLTPFRSRRRLLWVLAAASVWIGLESWQQYLTGANLFGATRYGDGALTGPFARPRAGPALILLLFPVLVPAASRLIGSVRVGGKVAGVMLCAFGAATVLLIAQRMPSALLVLGLGLTAALLPKLRIATAFAGVAGILLVASAPVLAPSSYAKLVAQTRSQLAHFAQSPYGEIWVRAAVIAGQHPWMGLGFDGFRRGCADPDAVRGLPALGVTLTDARQAVSACNIHPHNYYLEAADDGGLPSLALFTLMAAALGLRLSRGVTAGLGAGRAGLLVGYMIALWPIATTSAFSAMPNAGWIFLIAGLGWAEAGAVASPERIRR